MQLKRRGGSMRSLAVFVAVVLGLSACFITTYHTRFRLPDAVVTAHLVLVAGLLAITILLATWLDATARPPRRLVVLPLAVLAAALGFLDAVSWGARTFWVEDLSLASIAFYLPRIWRLAESTQAVPGRLLLVVLFGGTAAIATAVLLCARSLGGGIHRLAYGADGERGRMRSAGAMVVACSAAFLVGYHALAARDDVLGEPLAGLFPGVALRRDERAVSDAVPVLDRRENRALSRRDVPAATSVHVGPKNVVVIVIDGLRADHLSFAGYRRRTTPTLDRLATDGHAIVADWATSACSVSSCGIMAILGSVQYARQQLQIPTLPDVLEAAGYDLYFISSGDFSRLFPELNVLYGARSRMFVDGFSDERFGSLDDRSIYGALERLTPYAGRPSFFYFHLHSAHRGGAKYRKPTYRPAYVDTRSWALLSKHAPADSARLDTYTPEMQQNDYDNALLQADDMMAEILDVLNQRGYMRESVVVVTSDHGEEIGEYGHFGHGYDLQAPSIDVPIVIHDPTMTATRHVPYASHVDIAATIAACVGIDPPRQWEGRSLLSEGRAYSFHETTHYQPIVGIVWRTRRGAYKYLVDTKTRAESLYELEHDPHETTDVLATADPAIVAALRAAAAQNFPRVAQLSANLAGR